MTAKRQDPEPAAKSTKARRKRYHVYVVELSDDVLLNARFKRSNPDYQPGKPCVYVGMTGLDPDVRFDRQQCRVGFPADSCTGCRPGADAQKVLLGFNRSMQRVERTLRRHSKIL